MNSPSLIRPVYIALVLSFYFIPARAPSIYPVYLTCLILLGSLFPFFVRHFRYAEIAVFSLPPYLFIALTIGLVIFYGAGYRELRYAVLILPSLLIGMLVYGFVREGIISFEFGAKVVVVCGFLLSILCFIQYWNFFGLNEYLYPFVNEERGSLYLEHGVKRSLGMYGNPNETAYSIGISLFCLYLLKDVYSRALYFLLFAVIIVGLLSTGSRTVFVSVFLAFLAYFVMRRNFMLLAKFGLVCFASVFFAVVFSILYLDSSSMFVRVTDFTSLVSRFDYIWVKAYEFGLSHPVFGRGPARDIIGMTLTPDSKWLVWWVQWGLFGLLVFLFYFIFLFWYFGKKVYGLSNVDSSYRLGFLVFIYVSSYSLVVNVGMPETTPMTLIFIIVLVLSSCTPRIEVVER